MARRMPSSESTLILHPILSISLLVAWLAASIAILATLCASCHKKPTTTSPKSQSPTALPTSPATRSQQEPEEYIPPMPEERITELDAAIHGPIYPTTNASVGSTSKRRLSVSLSIGIKEGISRIKTKKEGHHSKGGGEESLWKKTIILGEKCKMQNDDDEEEAGNVLQSNNDVTSPGSQVSRNTSFASAETNQ